MNAQDLAGEAIQRIDSYLAKNRESPSAEDADRETEILLFVRGKLEEIASSYGDGAGSSSLWLDGLRIAELMLRFWRGGD